MIKAITKITLFTLLALAAVTVLSYGIMVYKHNREAPRPEQQQLKLAYQNAVSWLEATQDEHLRNYNSILWSFLEEAAQVNNDFRLARIVSKYKGQSVARQAWTYNFFDHTRPIAAAEVAALMRSDLPNYNKHFLYALSCDRAAASSQVIQKQMQKNFCYSSPPHSSCTTHQLMALEMMLDRRCGDTAAILPVVEHLHHLITLQLNYDPRLGDVYIQRLMMLAKTGKIATLKPVWIQQMLDTQLDSGAWEQFDPIFSLGDGYRFGFTYKFLGVRRPEPNLHVSAQAILLLAILLNDPEAPISRTDN